MSLLAPQTQGEQTDALRSTIGVAALLAVGGGLVLLLSLASYKVTGWSGTLEEEFGPSAVATRTLIGAALVGGLVAVIGWWERDRNWLRAAGQSVIGAALTIVLALIGAAAGGAAAIVLGLLTGAASFLPVPGTPTPAWFLITALLGTTGPAAALASIGAHRLAKRLGYGPRSFIRVTFAVGFIALVFGAAILRSLGFAIAIALPMAIVVPFVARRAPPRSLLPVGGAVLYFGAAWAGLSFAGEFVGRSELARQDDAALVAAGGRPPERCEGGTLPSPQSTGPTPRLIGRDPVWLQSVSLGTISVRSEDLVLSGLGSALLDPRYRGGNLSGALPTFFAVRDGYSETVVVRIIDSSDGSSVRAIGNSFNPVRGNPSNGYRTTVVDFFLTHAGCYTLEATWPGGSWRVALAAGQ